MTEKAFYKWIGQRIRELREQAGIKQKELAEKVGLSAQFLSNVENRGNKISLYQLNRVLDAMGLTHADLVDTKKKSLLSPLTAMS